MIALASIVRLFNQISTPWPTFKALKGMSDSKYISHQNAYRAAKVVVNNHSGCLIESVTQSLLPKWSDMTASAFIFRLLKKNRFHGLHSMHEIRCVTSDMFHIRMRTEQQKWHPSSSSMIALASIFRLFNQISTAWLTFKAVHEISDFTFNISHQNAYRAHAKITSHIGRCLCQRFAFLHLRCHCKRNTFLATGADAKL